MKKFIPETKIIATIGPSCISETVLRKMVLSGLDMVRINFSHGTYEDYIKHIENVRKINKMYRRVVKIIGDLEGFRIRIGFFKNRKEIFLEKNKSIYLIRNIYGNEKEIPIDYKGNFLDFEKAEFIFIDDGNIVLKIKDIDKDRIKVKVITGGILRQRKGINVPGVKLKFKTLNERDKKDIKFANENNFDFIALSFVRNKNDILTLKKEIGKKKIKVIAKIENREGIRNIDEIIDVSDGIMIARGDMGVSIPIYEVPFVQKEIIKECKNKRKFSITATQMLESMVENPVPTRAEVSDVANAVLDGTDCVMLSA
ncbi:pyruvate kinase, partial [bacterium]|nr:pyruvate kinase [bacterium]